MLTIHAISAFSDNYIWLLVNNNRDVIVVDPGDAIPVQNFVQTKQLNINSILLTHHHPDHSGGVKSLLQQYPTIKVYASHKSRVLGVTHYLKEGDIIELNKTGIAFEIEEIPGHTLDHIAFFSPLNTYSEQSFPILFTGDTLFSAGCGRIFEGTAEQMWSSLQKIKKHPLNTQIYCGHEYTLNNLKFALQVEPQNPDIQKRFDMVHELRSQNKPTIPATLELELKTNPFLRTDLPEIQLAVSQYANQKFNSEIEVFAALRDWKNNY